MMRRWVGRWIIIVGVIHCVFGAFVFIQPLSGIIRDGVWNAVDGYPGRPLAFWFEFLGMLTILFGATVDQIEKAHQKFPAFLGYSFSFLTLLGIIAMPVGGGWLLIPAAIGLLMKKSNR